MSEPARKKPRRWWRWTKRIVLALVVLLVLARIALPWVVPIVLDGIAADLGLTCQYEALDLSLLAGDLRLSGVTVHARGDDGKPEGEVLLRIDLIGIDVLTTRLLTGELHVALAEVDGVDLVVERAADGTYFWSRHLAGGAPTEPEPPLADETPSDAPVDFSPPVLVDVLRVQHLRVRIVDRAAPATLDTWVETNLRVNDLGHPDRDARVELHAHGPLLLDEFALEGHLRGGERSLTAKLSWRLRGARPQRIAYLLESLGITPRAERLDGEFELVAEVRPGATNDHAIDVHCSLTDLELRADGIPRVGIARVEAKARDTGAQRLIVDSIEIIDPHADLALLADGTLSVLGLELRPSAASTPPPPVTPPTPDTPSTVSEAFELTLLHADGGAIRFTDHSTEPATELALDLDDLALRDLRLDPKSPDSPATLAIALSAPGVAERIAFDALAVPGAARRTATLDLRASGITLERLAPYLAQAGLEPTLVDGMLTARLELAARTDAEGALHADVTLGPIELTDDDQLLAGLERIAVQGLIAESSKTSIETIDVDSLTVPIRRDAEGHLHVAGLRTRAPESTDPAQPSIPRTDPAAQPPDTPAPRIELGALRVRRTGVHLVDESLDPPLDFAPDEIELDLHDLAFGGPPDGEALDEARLRARIVAPQIAEELALVGTIRSRPGPLDVAAHLEIVGRRIVAGPFAAWLEREGIESTLRAGELRATIDADAKQDQGGTLTANARVSALSFRDGEAEPAFQLNEARIEGLRIADDGVSIGPITIDGPRVRASRDRDGALHFAGLKFAPRPPSTAPQTATPVADEPAPAPAGAFALAGVDLHGTELIWSDAAVDPPVTTTLTLEATIDRLGVGPGASATQFNLTLRASDAIDRLQVTGSLVPDPDDLRAELALRGTGLRAGTLGAYLPEGMEPDWTDGRLALDAAVRVARAAQGGLAIDTELREASLHDGDTTLASLQRLAVRAPRIDPEGKRFEVAEIVTEGLVLDVVQSDDGTVSALGVAFRPAPTPAPVLSEPESATPTQPTPPASTEPAPLPLVTLDRLDLGIARLRFLGAGTKGSPLEASLRLFNPQPLVLLDADPEALPPLVLHLDGAATPLLDALSLDLTAAPWQPDCKITADFEASGLRGERLTEVLPALAEHIDGSELTDGSIRGTAELIVDLHRRTPTDIDFARGFGIDFELRGLEMRATPDGEVLAGVESVVVEAPRIVPGGDTQISLIDIAGLKGRAHRDERGLHVAGITLLPPPPATEPTPGESVAVTPAPVPAATPTPEASPRRPELRVNEFTMRGIDLVYRDDTSDPPMVLPLDALDVEVRNFTTRSLTDGVPFRFAASLGAGAVELPESLEASSLVSGVLGAALGAVTGRADQRKLESRPLLDEIAIDGSLALGPVLDGRIRTSINGLELGAFRGLAKQSGVDIGDGVLDAGITLRFLGARGLRTDATFGFHNLSISEPAGGPISTYLKLPAPLDTVLFALRDQNADVRIPLKTRIEGSGMTSGQIATAAITALGKVIADAIADAIAAAPFRAVGIVTGLFGIGGGSAAPIADQKVAIDFELGDAALTAKDQERLTPLIELLQDDETVAIVLQHQPGAGDLARAATLANPSPQDARAVADRLRRALAQLLRERQQAEATLRATVGAADPRSAWLRNRELHTLDARIAETGDALDHVVALLRPGAERRADRRTRDAAVDLGTFRLQVLRQALLDLGGKTIADRIELRSARATDPLDQPGGQVLLTPRVRQPQELVGPQKQAMPLERLDPIDALPKDPFSR